MAGTEKGYTLNIHKFYTFHALDHVLFGFVLGMTQALPGVSVNKAIELWLERFNLCEEVYCVEAARASYYRVLKSLKDKEVGMAEYPEPDSEPI